MKNNYVRLGLLGLLVLALVAAAVPRDEVMLRLKLDAGQSFAYQTMIDQDIRQEVMGQPQDVIQQIGMGTRFDVLSAAEGVYDVKVSYVNVSMTQESPMGTVTYNSIDPPETVPQAAIGFAALVGQSFTMKLDDQAHVLELDGVDAMLDAMIAAFGDLDEATQGQIRDGLQAQFGDEALRSQMENMLAIYPEGPVGEGASWVKEVDVAMGMAMHLTNTYNLVERNDGIAKVDIVSTVEPGEGGPVSMGGMSLEYDVSGTQEGSSWIDESTGLITRFELTQQIAGDVTMNGNMTWPIELDTHTTMERMEVQE